MFNVPPDVGLHMFRVRPEQNQPGFRVGWQDSPPGFRVNSDGSTYTSAPNRPGTQFVSHGVYGEARPESGLATAMGLDPNGEALGQWLRVNQMHPHASPSAAAVIRRLSSDSRNLEGPDHVDYRTALQWPMLPTDANAIATAGVVDGGTRPPGFSSYSPAGEQRPSLSTMSGPGAPATTAHRYRNLGSAALPDGLGRSIAFVLKRWTGPDTNSDASRLPYGVAGDNGDPHHYGRDLLPGNAALLELAADRPRDETSEPYRHHACTEAVYSCLQDGPLGERGIRWRDDCHAAERQCNDYLDYTRRFPLPAGKGMTVLFPNKGYVEIPSGRRGEGAYVPPRRR